MFDPPPGYDDLLGDAETAPSGSRFYDLDVPSVGVIQARRPLPNAVAALAMAANAQIDVESRTDYLVLFVRNHLGEGELERIYHDMITGDTPADSIERIARAVATWGTARPTSPSSHSV
jgi:hypothetical protein